MLSFPCNLYLLPSQGMTLEYHSFDELKTEFLTDHLESGDAILESVISYVGHI